MKSRLTLSITVLIMSAIALFGISLTEITRVGGIDAVEQQEIEVLEQGSVIRATAYAAKNLTVVEKPGDVYEPDEYTVTTWYKYTAALSFGVPAYTEAAVTKAPEAETTVPSAGTSVIMTDAAPPVKVDASDKLSQSYPDGFTFIASGYGHGCGLSQNGANYYAIYGGYNYQQILAHYYQGATLASTGTGGKETITVNGISGSALDIIAMVCNQEVGPSFHVETIKAQAVAAYTFVKYNGGSCSGLGMKANPPAKVYNAVAEVIGQALYYNGKFCLAQFYASSGGTTANCKDVFTADLPYLRAVESAYDKLYDPYYGKQYNYSVEYVKSVLESKLGIKLSDNPENWIKIVYGDHNSNYAASVIIDGQKTVRATKFKSYFGFRTTCFSVTLNNAKSEEPDSPAAETPDTQEAAATAG